MLVSHHATVAALLADQSAAETIGKLFDLREAMPDYLRRFFVGPIDGSNGYVIYAMLSGARNEDQLAQWREAFIALVHDLRASQEPNEEECDLVSLQFGGDLRYTVLMDTTDSHIALSPEVIDRYTTESPRG